MLIVFEPLVTSKRIKNAIFGLSLNFYGTPGPLGTPQTAFRAAKPQWMSDTLKSRRNFNFDLKWSIFGFLDLLEHSASVLNCALCYLKIRKITCSLLCS